MSASAGVTYTGIVGVAEAKAKLAALLKRVAAGETIVITQRGQPVATLAPLDVRTAAEIGAPSPAPPKPQNGPLTLSDITKAAQ